MKDQGFYEEFSIQDSQITHSARSTSVALKRLDNVNGTYLENIASWLMHNGGIPENIAHDLVSISLLEVINNVFDHSLSPIGCYISAQAYHRKEQLILSILDLGIGFYQSLKQFYPEIRTDVDAIDKAVQEGVSSKKIIENKVRGVGLTNISGFIKNRGALHIISYNGTWYQDHSGKITTRSINCPLHGVCVNLSIDTKSMFELAEYGDEVWGE
ncbi:MAG: hypothetical protein LLF86_06040 [Nitrospiraceae bacterium]|nr:hypothetical protein [Nitrospiraceae bacterium]